MGRTLVKCLHCRCKVDWESKQPAFSASVMGVVSANTETKGMANVQFSLKNQLHLQKEISHSNSSLFKKGNLLIGLKCIFAHLSYLH